RRVNQGGLAVLANGEILVFEQDDMHSPRIWEATKGRAISELQLREEDGRHDYWAASFSPDGKLVATVNSNGSHATDEGVCVWEVATGKKIREWKKDDVGDIAFSSDGKLLAITSDEIHLYDAVTGEEAQERHGGGNPPSATVSFSKGRFLVRRGEKH